MSVDMERLARDLKPDSVTAASQLRSIAPSYDAMASKVEKLPVRTELQNTHQETFQLTDEWYCEDWAKCIAWIIRDRMTYGQFIEMMDGINASFAEVDKSHPEWNGEQISHKAAYVWADKKLSK